VGLLGGGGGATSPSARAWGLGEHSKLPQRVVQVAQAGSGKSVGSEFGNVL